MSEVVNPAKEYMPHSRWGSLSFWLGLFTFGALCALFVIFAYLHVTIPGFWDLEDSSTLAIIWGGLVCGCFFMSYTAFIFGVVGVCQLHARNVFALWGLLLSGIPTLFVVMGTVHVLFAIFAF